MNVSRGQLFKFYEDALKLEEEVKRHEDYAEGLKKLIEKMFSEDRYLEFRYQDEFNQLKRNF